VGLAKRRGQTTVGRGYNRSLEKKEGKAIPELTKRGNARGNFDREKEGKKRINSVSRLHSGTARGVCW